MFIFTEPYISPLARRFIETAEPSSILHTEFLADSSIKMSTDFIAPDHATELLTGTDGRWLYSNSENALIILDEILPRPHRIRECIELFKNKHLFRQRYRDIFPGVDFALLTLDELMNFKYTDFNKPFILKPAVGFLSAGVYRITGQEELESVQSRLISELAGTSRSFPKSVIDNSTFLIESIISGREFAIDAFYDDSGNPVIINIFEHIFKDETDMTDRLYISSGEIINQWLAPFKEFLAALSSITDLKGFTLHVEIRVDDKGHILPIEVNPLRFAGWCTTDLCYWAHGINPYEYLARKEAPDWKRICDQNDDRLYCMSLISSPLVHSATGFDYDKLAGEFSDLKELRRADFSKYPLFGFAFYALNKSDTSFIDWILRQDFKDYCNFS